MMPPGGRLTNSCDAAAGVTRLGFETAAGRLPAVHWSVRAPAGLSCRASKEAIPAFTVTWVVPIRAPEPLASEAVTCVLLSLLITLPFGSSSATTMGSVSGVPAITVAYGWIWITRWLAAAGLTTMLED